MFISYFKNSMKTIYQSWHIHKTFDSHAFLLNAHGTKNLTKLCISPYYISVHKFFLGSNENIRGSKGSMVLIC